MKSKPRVLFLSHGAGPLPLLGDHEHKEMVDCLKNFAGTIKKPSAILVVSAHWEENVPTVISGATPPLIYDYYGFPEESYTIQYPCPGEPLLAGYIANLLKDVGFAVDVTHQRGLDHGVLSPKGGAFVAIALLLWPRK